jgi:uncharacterized membrane-anchored protein
VLDPHPDREAVVNELHARPFADVRPPARVSHLAFLSAEEDAERDREHLASLCVRLGAVPPAPGARHHMADFGPVAVKWERHTEFSSYTFIRPGAPADPFADPALAAVPADWLAATPGRLLVAVHLALVPADAGRDDRELAALCGSDRHAGAVVAGGAAAVWTDFRLHGDGFVRVLAEDRGLSERQAGRLVQRLLEVETYRTAALLGLPLALRLWPEVRALERRLAALACRVAEVGDLGDERALLDELARLDAAATRLAAEHGYRFAAARAYHEIVRRRLAELREGRIEGLQTLAEFMDRRLLPAMETCRAMERRLEALLGRAAHASSLLRTAVDVALEAQNRDILRSMERRATQQLRLQQTVEGLFRTFGAALTGRDRNRGKSPGSYRAAACTSWASGAMRGGFGTKAATRRTVRAMSPGTGPKVGGAAASPNQATRPEATSVRWTRRRSRVRLIRHRGSRMYQA